MSTPPSSSPSSSPSPTPPADEIITIKKYANRRLYNTASSKYITLEALAQMIKEGQDFVVYDAKSGEDITRAVLTQIILEEEAKGENLLPLSFLKQIIGFYGQSMDWILPKYLEHMMQSFAASQEQMNEVMHKSMGGFFPFANLQDLSKSNMALWEQAVKLFNPLSASEETKAPKQTEDDTAAENTAAGPSGKAAQETSQKNLEDIKALQEQLAALQQQIDKISKK